MRAVGAASQCGATSKDTNFIHEVEQTIHEETQDNQLTEALEAALDKKAQDIVVIELEDICSFTDHFLSAPAPPAGTIKRLQKASTKDSAIRESVLSISKDTRKANGS